MHNPGALTKPMIRKDGVAKTAALLDPETMWDVFREATWEEALDLAGGKLRTIRDERGPQALAGFGSAKGSNEEAYLFQKLVRTGFRTNNVDHCTRLCHASSVAALLEDVGSGAGPNQVEDVALADVAIVIGSNPTVNHPVAATFMKNAAKNGTKIILMDPRRSDLARHATYFLQFNGDTDVALLNGMHARHRRRRARQRNLRSRANRELRSAASQRRRLSAGEGRPDHRASTRKRSATSLGCTRPPTPRSSSGAWASRSTSTAPTTRAA